MSLPTSSKSWRWSATRSPKSWTSRNWRELEAEVNKNAVEIASLTEQLGKLRKGLKGLSAEDQKTIEQKSKYDDEEAIIEAFQNRLDAAGESVQSLAESFSETADDGKGGRLYPCLCARLASSQ
jgi:chromosome segregation ATPase